MQDYTLGAIEAKFAGLIWDNEPVSSGQLVKLCEKELGWKKSTTYTVLKRLCQKGLFQNKGGEVTSLLSREEFAGRQSEEFLQTAFDGSLPKFVAAFSRRKKLSEGEIAALQDLIDRSREEG